MPMGIGSGSGGGIGSGQGGGDVTAPSLIYRVEPEYTAEARAAKYQGTVVLYAEVSPDGTTRNVRVIRSLGLGLDQQAIECVEKWKFRPGQRDGKPLTVATTIEVDFRL